LVVLANALNLSFIDQLTIDPIGRAITAPYLQDGDTAYFELAAASGIALLKDVPLAPLRTTTLGTGRIMRMALDAGTRNLVLGLGGSCTTDAGLGIAYELGVRFYDKNKQEVIPAGGNLSSIVALDTQQMVTINQLTILCDVSNPLYTGEGQLDKTSLDGKVVGGVAALCQQYGKSLIAVVGNSTLSIAEKEALGLDQIYTVLERAGSVEVAIRDTSLYLEEIGQCLLFSQG